MGRSLAAVAVVLLLGVGPAAAGTPTERLRGFFDRVNHVILAPETDSGLEDRLGVVRALVNELIDFDGAAALALGRHWQNLAPADHAAITHLYAELVERAYLSWVGGKARMGEHGVSVRWRGETIGDDGIATVRSALITRAGTELDVDYRMVRRGADWLVRDVIVDGVSLAASYRAQFKRVLQQGSHAELMARMREKSAPAGAASSAASVRGIAPAPPPAAPPLALPPATAAAGRASLPASGRVANAPAVVIAAIRSEPGAVVSDVRPSAVREPLAPVRAPMTASRAAAAPMKTAPVTTSPPALASKSRVAATAAAPRRHAATGRAVWVQVAVFRGVDAAARLMHQLRHYAVTLTIGGDGDASRARVLVGPFADRSAAAAVMRALHASGVAAFITDSAPN